MVVVENMSAQNIDKSTRAIHSDAVVITDNHKSFNMINKRMAQHHAFTLPGERSGIALPWVHNMIANLKRDLLGNHHSLKDNWLESYLDAFCYKVN